MSNIVSFPMRNDESESPDGGIPDKSYRRLFRAADSFVRGRPWERWDDSPLFSLIRPGQGERWLGTVAGQEGGVATFRLLLLQSTAERVLEARVVASDFLQGSDYDLNVRFAPELWDSCERDVLVLAALEEGESREVTADELAAITIGLESLAACMGGGRELGLGPALDPNSREIDSPLD